MDLFLRVLHDAGLGFFDAVTGLLFIKELDKNVVVAPVEQRARLAQPTVFGRRREREGRGPPPRAPDPVAAPVKTSTRVLHCIGMNTAVLAGLWVLQYFLPFLAKLIGAFDNCSGVLSFVSVLPFFVFTRFFNYLWASDIAGGCMRALNVKASRAIPRKKLVNDFILSFLLEFSFLIQSSLVISVLPIPGIAPMLSFLHFCLLNSLYSFEYIWTDQAIMLYERINIIQRHWPYFFGFGFLLTLAGWISPNFIISGCTFGALFPLFIISSTRAAAKREEFFHGSGRVPLMNIFAPTRAITEMLATRFANFLLDD